MHTIENAAVVVIDAGRGFFPITDRYTAQLGYGELPVPGAHEIIEPIHELLRWSEAHGLTIATTQDWHPEETAHFAKEGTEPNYTTTWPRHCVDGTLGAELHEDLWLPASARRFRKGMEVLERGEDDTSYSGANAIDPVTEHSLPLYLEHHGITKLLLAGLTIDYCLRASGLDFKNLGFEVAIALDACRGVAPESSLKTLGEFAEAGIDITTTKRWMGKLALDA